MYAWTSLGRPPMGLIPGRFNYEGVQQQQQQPQQQQQQQQQHFEPPMFVSQIGPMFMSQAPPAMR